MKTYIITCLDKKNSLNKRLANRELHLKYLKSFKDKIILAGPILNKTNKSKGSVLILKFQILVFYLITNFYYLFALFADYWKQVSLELFWVCIN